jgi:hypothetical protein
MTVTVAIAGLGAASQIALAWLALRRSWRKLGVGSGARAAPRPAAPVLYSAPVTSEMPRPLP